MIDSLNGVSTDGWIDSGKELLVGADITHLCSVLLQQGSEHIAVLRQELNYWLEEH